MKPILKDEWYSTHPFQKEPHYLVPIRWVLERFKLEKGMMRLRKGRRKLWLGFCLATNHLCKIQFPDGVGTLTVLVVQNAIIKTKDGKAISCEESKRCLNIDCVLNHTTKESFVSANAISEETAKKMDWTSATSYRKLRWK